MQPFQLGHHFCQMCNFGEYKKRSEAFSTTPTPHKSAGDSGQPQERPPSPPRSVREGHRLETPGGRERSGPACGQPGLSQPSGAEPSPTRWSRVSHLPWRSGPRRPLQRPAPTVGAPSLLELLDLLQAQPRALVDAKVAQHLLHRLCVSVLHGCGGPGRPRLASPRPPRLRLALGPRARATAGARAQTAVPSSFSSSAAAAASA